MVVIDEAHRLRNVSNVIANTLKVALGERNKLLLSATPLQNSLLELFGLVSFVDEHSFGDLKSFREQFAGVTQERAFDLLRERLKPICHRTLRRQVTAYVPFTKRHAILQKYEAEDRLYNLVTAYLQRENLQALPSGQRALMTLVLRKLLASSSFAIAGALASISERLQSRLDKGRQAAALTDTVDEDYEALDETEEEWADEDHVEPLSEADLRALENEITELREVKTGKTTVLTGEQARELLDSIDTSTMVGLRDRALIAVMIFAFARISAVVAMRVEDYYPKGKRWWVRLHEKGGKRHEIPAHHNLEADLDAYIKAAGIGDDGKSPLFRSAVGRTDMLTEKPMNRVDAWRMVQRRAADLGAQFGSAATHFGQPGSRPISRPAERLRTRKPWRRMKAPAQQSFMIERAMRLRSMRSSGSRFERGPEVAAYLPSRALRPWVRSFTSTIVALVDRT